MSVVPSFERCWYESAATVISVRAGDTSQTSKDFVISNLPKSTWRSRFSYLESLLRETCWVCETTPQVLLKQLIDYKCLTRLATRQIVSKRFKSFQSGRALDLSEGASALARNDPTLLAKNNPAPLVNRYG